MFELHCVREESMFNKRGKGILERKYALGGQCSLHGVEFLLIILFSRRFISSSYK